MRSGNVEFMGIYTRRDGHQYTPAQTMIAPNPTTWSNNNFFAKLVIKPTEVDTLRLTGGYSQGAQSTNVLSAAGNFASLFARIYDEWGQDYANTYRISGQWEHNAPIGFVDRLSLLAYFNSVYTQADTYTLRGAFNGVTPTNGRASQFYYTQNVAGGELQMHTDRQIGGLDNFFTYGASFSWTTTTRPRNRTQITLATGATTNSVGGELYPNKNFPDTDTVQAGIYVQDEISALGGRLKITPAVRLDYYNMTPNPIATSGTPRAPRSTPCRRPPPTSRPRRKLGLLLPLRRHLFGLLPVRDGLPRAAVRQRELRLHQRRVVLPDPAQRQPEARDGATASKSACAANTRTARAGSSPASTISTTTSSRRPSSPWLARSRSSSTSTSPT